MTAIHGQSTNVTMGMAYGIAAALIWGIWPVLSRLGVSETLTAFDITALRFGVSGLILLPLVFRHSTKNLGWKRALFLSCGAGAPYVLVMVTGLSLAPAGHAGVITPSCMLIFSTIGSGLFLGDTLTRARRFGLPMIIVGVLLIGWDGFANLSGDVLQGDILFAVGGLLWASYTVASRAWQVDPVHATALVSVISMTLYLPFYVLMNEPHILSAPLGEVLFQGLFQGVLAASLGLIFYTRSVAILGASQGAVFAALVPGIAVLLAYPILGEVPSVHELIGVLVVSFGMVTALGLLRFRQATHPPARRA